MNRPKRQRRYRTEAEIIGEIDACRAMVDSYMAAANQSEDLALKLAKLAADTTLKDDERRSHLHHSKDAFKARDKALKSATSREKRLKKLGEKLSAFRTMLMTAITTDPAVV